MTARLEEMNRVHVEAIRNLKNAAAKKPKFHSGNSWTFQRENNGDSYTR